jgi:hypothetical protein
MTYRNVCLRLLLTLAVVLGVGFGCQSLFGSALFWPGVTVQAAAAPPPVPCPVCNDNNDDTFDSCVNGQCVFTPIDGIPATVVFTLNDSGRGSLRAAIEAANNSPADDVITFWVNGTITLTSGELTVGGSGKLTIQGNGMSQTIISGNNATRVFNINPYNYFSGTDVTFNHLTIEKGNVRDNFHSCNFGGAIYNPFSTVTMNHCTISGNSATGGACTAGGAIFSGGTLNLTNCTFTNNGVSDGDRGGDQGGAIMNAGMVNMTNCTITNNFTGKPENRRGAGGGIYSLGGTLNLTNCTFSGNSAGLGGAIIGAPSLVGNATVNLTNCTITNNSSSAPNSVGGGILSNGTINIRNTIIAGNTASRGPDVYGSLTSQGYNLIGNNADTTITPTTGDQIGTAASPINPQLAPLANNGGPTQTHALLANSPALDAGDNCVLTNICASPNPGFALTTDQRGTPFNRLVGNRVDIGAFEFVPSNTPPTLSYASNPSTTYGTALTITPTDGPSDDGSVASVQLISAPVPGITINSSGVISVAATVPAGSYPLQVQATDNCGGPNGTTTVTLTLTVNRAPLTVTVNNAWRNQGEVNPPFSGTIAGLKNGDVITASYSTMATPSSAAGPYPITATLSDPGNRLGNYTVTNTPGTLTVLASCSAMIMPAPLPPAALAQIYAAGLTVVALSAGTAGPYTFTHVAGQLPLGLTLVNTVGVFSLQGVPTTPGTYTFTLLATRVAGGCSRAVTYRLTIAPTVVPIAECIINHGNGTYTVRFGYENTTGSVVTIPVGLNNMFSVGAQNRNQPTVFQVGRVTNAFTVTFQTNGSDASNWLLKGPDNILRGVMLTATGPTCP